MPTTLVVLMSFVLGLPGPGVASSDSIEMASQNLEGVAGNGSSSAGEVSADGRYIAFVSSASNLVGGDTNQREDVFVKDTITGEVERISLATDGTQMGGGAAAMSRDGRYVAFVHGRAAYVRDRQTATTTQATPNGYHDSPRGLSISADGRKLVFSTIDRLIPEDTNSCLPLPPGMPKPQDYDYCGDVYLSDLQDGTLRLVSVSSSGTQGNEQSGPGYVSADGRFVVFSSAAWNLVLPDVNGRTDLFIRDLAAGTISLLTRASDGAASNGDSFVSSVSADGRFIAFQSTATNLAQEDQLPLSDVYVLDRQTSVITVESVVVPTGALGLRYFNSASISDDGRRVGFNGIFWDGLSIVFDVFVRDRAKGSTIEIASRPLGDRSTHAIAARISGDGSALTFSSDRSWLVPNDTNNLRDAFLVRFQPTCPGGGREDGTLSAAIRRLNLDESHSQVKSLNCEVLVPSNL